QLVVIYTGLPQMGIKMDVITCALVGLILNEAAYLAEIVRGGFMAVSPGQGTGPAEMGDVPARDAAAGVSPDDSAARQLGQRAAQGDVAGLRHLGGRD